MAREPMKTNLTAFETEVAVVVPDTKEIVKAKVTSNVGYGLTIEIPTGIPMWKLHDMFANGLIHEVSFFHKPAEKAV